jgi:hypothetical protein
MSQFHLSSQCSAIPRERQMLLPLKGISIRKSKNKMTWITAKGSGIPQHQQMMMRILCVGQVHQKNPVHQ